jgi:nucleoside-diphosphate-sugar epimerase
MKKILITGAAGYIGSMLTTKLVELGFSVLAVDLLKYDENSLSHLSLCSNFSFLKADITKPKVVKRIIKNVDFIIPLAALVGAPLCEKYKKQAKRINVNSIKLILKFIKKKQKIIYPTTNSGYGVGKKDKYCDELSELNPISLYGKTKLDAERIVGTHKNSISFRLATVFGCSYRMRTDLLVNNFVFNAINKKRLDLYEPEFRRNFIHIIDVVNAFTFSIKNFEKLKSNVYNLGLSSANLNKLMLAKLIKKKIKKLKIRVVKDAKDPDQRDYYVSNKKIEKKGFKAKISLEEGIEELVNFFTFNKKKFINNY